MDELRAYDIDFLSLPPEGEARHYAADDAWFEAVGATDIRRGDVEMDVRVRPLEEGFELRVALKGEVEVTCDRCLEPMRQPIDATATLRARLGEEQGDDGDVITVAQTDGTYNIAWNLYEQIALALPLRHVHPDGACTLPTGPIEKAADPRWDALRGLHQE